jgi:hypothetical protein
MPSTAHWCGNNDSGVPFTLLGGMADGMARQAGRPGTVTSLD